MGLEAQATFVDKGAIIRGTSGATTYGTAVRRAHMRTDWWSAAEVFGVVGGVPPSTSRDTVLKRMCAVLTAVTVRAKAKHIGWSPLEDGEDGGR